MDFSFSEEQTLLRNSVQSWLRDKYDFETRRKIVSGAEGWRRDYWRQFAELGLLGMLFPEEQGGLGGGPVEAMIVMEEFGRHLVVEPYLETIVLAGGLLRDGGTAAQHKAHLPGLIGGEEVWTLAYAESQGRYNLADLVTTAKKQGASYVINGHKAMVFAGPWADKLIVTARSSGGQRDRSGVSLFIVNKKAAGVSTRDYPTVDGRRASEISFENVKLDADALIGEEDNGLGLLEAVTDQAIGALCAEAIGAMKELNEATVDYTKTRKQFGVPIGKFQALQHRMVDMFIAHEQSISMTYLVNLKLGEAEAERRRAASGAKVQIGKAGKLIGQEAVQLHGGMGVTDELNVGHYFKRLAIIDTQFGNIDHHLKRYAAA